MNIHQILANSHLVLIAGAHIHFYFGFIDSIKPKSWRLSPHLCLHIAVRTQNDLRPIVPGKRTTTTEALRSIYFWRFGTAQRNFTSKEPDGYLHKKYLLIEWPSNSVLMMVSGSPLWWMKKCRWMRMQMKRLRISLMGWKQTSTSRKISVKTGGCFLFGVMYHTVEKISVRCEWGFLAGFGLA